MILFLFSKFSLADAFAYYEFTTAAGNFKVNVLPFPTSDFTVRSPPRAIAISLLMLKPKPFPLGFAALDSVSSVLWNGLKRDSTSASVMPIPVSFT